jgi:hypothetical protein
MGLVSAETIRRRLRDLSDERFRDFVGALWAARGAETSRAGDVVKARRDEQRLTLRPVTGRRLPADVTPDDVVVLARPASGVRGADAHPGRVVDANDLHAMLLYAVPRETADDLCRRFFDRPLRSADDVERRPVAARVPEYSAPLVVGLLGVVLVVAGVFGGPALYGGDPGVFGAPDSIGSGDAQVETPAADPTGTPPGTESAAVQSGRYPPGLGPEGVVDEDALADAHAKAVTGRSYRLTITHREFVDGRPTAYRRETVSVVSPSEYRTDIEGAGELRGADLVVSSVEAFADGERRYTRRVIADEFDPSYTVDATDLRGIRNGEDRYGDRAERYVEWYLSVSESEIVDTVERDGTRYYWVRLGRDPYPGVENSSGSALVDETGVVHEIRRQYDRPGGDGVSAVVTLRYTDFGETTVRPPAWYEERVGTDATTADGPSDSATNGSTTGAQDPATTANGTATATAAASVVPT